MATPLPRPRPVLLAGWLIIGASLLSLVAAFDLVHSLGSMTMADKIEHQLDRPVFDGVTLSVTDVENWIRGIAMVSAVCASTMAVLAWQMLQERSTTARLWLTILAVPTFLTGMVTGSFFATMTVICVGLLWGLPARQWFAGTWRESAEPPQRRPQAPAGQARQARDPFAAPPQVSAPVTEVPPVAPGSQPPPMAAWPPPVADQAVTGPAHPAVTLDKTPSTRPSAVLSAAILTWVFSILAGAAFVISGIVLALDPTRVMDELRRTNPDLMAQQNVTEGMIQAGFIVLATIVVLWALSACVLAFLLLRRVAWARVVLIVCSGAAALALILASLASPLMFVPFAAAALTVGLLARRDVAAWLTRP
ncbi:hypothetical protein [Nocardioides sp.]|uniref:hypothetical protein n=1 Tax=Nocardioides sp. TaxID=35761 RepID=UPI00261F8277|nr:hypothetical protein [Nocardioides sp.]